MLTFLFLGIFVVSLIVSFAATRQVRDVASRRGWVSLPRDGRHVHDSPLPRLGGVAIFLAFSLSLILWLGLAVLYPRLLEGLAPATLLRIYVPACLIFCLGIYDDLHGASPWLKFSVQGIAATMLFVGGMRILDLPVLFGAHTFPWFVGLPLTVLWVVAITNAFNLIDGLDGLAAGSALFSTVVFFVVALVSHSWLGSLMSVALAGAILGFLRFNFNPATIFLGDSGSLFIGFVLSALALAGAQKAPTLVAVAIPVVSFGLPILETLLSIMRRLISGRPVFTADREHIHHKLLQMGMSHRQVVIVLYAVSALFAMLSLFLLWPTGSTLGLVLAVVGTGIWLGVQHLNYLEFGELRRVAMRTMEQRQIVINNLAIRRAVEELRVASDFDQIRSILLAAFHSNDFDAFELQLKSLASDGLGETHKPFHWTKFQHIVSISSLPSWKLSLDLITTSNKRRGSLMVYRVYSQRGLQLDVNLVTSEFPVVLADALDRVLTNPGLIPAAGQSDPPYLAANL
ncbi:MAG: undecaprenyl/decaprenyl-phosphate alpha-N-acetylglucosaminyl 1-phosphate transferase [Acidobacteria bacterium]|nr:MAG: undecaprenyl/decaprenyl-phosphate alpha-N-acetylglucosaminyl 1-phosphate transferase [Acidobacteriota bacterium]